jgi:imidazolonepropionase-like amidohydrolase
LYEEAYQSSTNDVRAMSAAGVQLLAGTDAGSVLVYPGFSLHEELRLLVHDAGLSPKLALRAATAAPARFFGMEETLGAIEPLHIADIVLLDADPLANIRNTRRVFAVIQGGHIFARNDLDGLLRDARTAAAR